MRVSEQQARHLFAFVVHFAAFWFLLGFAIAEDSSLKVYSRQFWWVHEKLGISPRRWYYNCIDADGNLDSTLFTCADDDKRFYVKQSPNETITHINVLVLASLYVIWSALGHLLSVFFVDRQRELRWLDYAVTAPTMLVVVSVAFGADSATAIVAAPVVLAVLLVAAGILERRQDELTGVKGMSFYRTTTMAMLFLAFVPVMVPLLYASYDITVDYDPGTGTAPDFVFAFSLYLTVCFSSFAVLYAWDLGWPMDSNTRERRYIFLSMIAKTSLHLFLGLAVIGQSNGVGVNEPKMEADNMDTLAIGLGGAGALVVGLGFIHLKFSTLFGYSALPEYKHLTQMWMVQLNEPAVTIAHENASV